MRTKALMCAAFVAAGLVSAVAQQNVYSLNVVGYVNVSVPNGYSLLANPLSAGATNGANEIMTPIDGEQILTWNGSSYNYVSYDTGYGGWIDAAQAPSHPPSLPPGKGFFFYNPGTATTVTFVGQVVPNPGQTNKLALPNGYSLIGSPMPVSGQVHTAMGLPLVDGLQMLIWGGSSYTYRSYDTGYGGWIDANQAAVAEPTINSAQGFFFYNPNTATTWDQSLP